MAPGQWYLNLTLYSPLLYWRGIIKQSWCTRKTDDNRIHEQLITMKTHYLGPLAAKWLHPHWAHAAFTRYKCECVGEYDWSLDTRVNTIGLELLISRLLDFTCGVVKLHLTRATGKNKVISGLIYNAPNGLTIVSGAESSLDQNYGRLRLYSKQLFLFITDCAPCAGICTHPADTKYIYTHSYTCRLWHCSFNRCRDITHYDVHSLSSTNRCHSLDA